MKNSKIGFIFDKIIWTTIILLPIVLYIILLKNNPSGYNFEDIFTSSILNYFGVRGNSFYSTIESIFSEIGVCAVTDLYGILYYITYIISVEIMHLMVNVMLYIPRIAMKWLRKGVDD